MRKCLDRKFILRIPRPYPNFNFIFFPFCLGDRETVEALLKTDTHPINKIDDEHFTPLLLAAKHHYPDICKLLLQNGADVHASDNDGMNVRKYARTDPSSETYKIIRECLSDQEEFLVLVEDPKTERFRIARALESKIDPNVTERKGKSSALMLAIQNENHSAIELLCEHKADVSLTNNSGDRPLHLAVKYGKLSF